MPDISQQSGARRNSLAMASQIQIPSATSQSSLLSPQQYLLVQVLSPSVARRGEFSHFVGFLAQKGGQIFEDGDLWD